MSRLTIVEGNSNDKDNVRLLITKGEKGADGVSPSVTTSKEDGVATINITDAEGTKSVSVEDGFDPIVTTSKTGKVTTVTIEDAEGTHTATINDGEDGETYGVPTNSVIGWDSADNIPNGYEEIDNPNNYSSSEKVIGQWIDGKPLYRKVVDIGNLPNTTYKDVPHNVSNMDKTIKLYGYVYNAEDNVYYPLPYVSVASPANDITIYRRNTVIRIYTNIDKSSETGMAIIEYTKTTD